MPERITKELKRLMKRFTVSDWKQKDELDYPLPPRPMDGTIQIENGSVKITDPSQGGKYPIIEGIEPLILFINKSRISLPVRVSSLDQVQWKMDEPPLFSIEVSKDKMRAYLRVNDNKRYGWKLMQHPPAHHAQIKAERDTDNVLETLEISMILDQLERLGISGHIDQKAILAAIEDPIPKPVLIAYGLEPIAGKDADLELYFALEEQTYLTEKDGKVDYRQHLHIPMIRAGELMAKKREKGEGTPGRNVYGQIIPPSPAKDVVIAARQHVEIREPGEVYALKDGRPRMLGDSIKFFDVSTSYIVQGNVDMNTGHIIFIGDVVIYGDVMDGMLVEALGKVFVSGHVYHATISATGGIHVQGNVITSRLYSGMYGVDHSRLYMELKKLSEQVSLFIEAAELLNKHLHDNRQTVRMGRLLVTLMDQKFSHLPGLFHELISLVHSVKMNTEHDFTELRVKLESFIKPQNIQSIQSLEELYDLYSFMDDARQKIRTYEEKKSPIELRQCQHSLLKATGDIRIKKEGMIQSDLYTEGNAVFYDQHSVCRGGVIIAEGSISAMAVGGEGSGRTQLTAGYRILAESLMETRICIGRHCKEITEWHSSVKALIRNNTLVLESGNKDNGDE
ncbi:DUF342 domain-containing protein [Ammoniphilus sp. 3BR4]|uniref:DUF342 domain-containing protein n=1 Tax=Ammoniphilus sp. 3BR4 TaxID=3158265 RepID=UPI0034667E3A